LGRLKNKWEELKRALRGLIGPHLRFMLEQQLRHIDALTQLIAALDEEIELQIRPFDRPLERIRNIEGLGKRTTQEIIGVIGTDLSRVPTSSHLVSWTGVAPGNNESAWKRRSGRTTKRTPLLRSALIEAAHASARTKNTFLSRLYHRIAARRGSKRAIVAVAHYILVIIYHLLKEDQEYLVSSVDALRRTQT
ncbi:transposase, partial [Parageobacillus thermoglucosidasius]|uniref:transposase n=1 Tax=Parageobacillus thermoglucosidasius TaxID=1426 RepID=UPI00241FF3CB